jgi:hypothetical protein
VLEPPPAPAAPWWRRAVNQLQSKIVTLQSKIKGGTYLWPAGPTKANTLPST